MCSPGWQLLALITLEISLTFNSVFEACHSYESQCWVVWLDSLDSVQCPIYTQVLSWLSLPTLQSAFGRPDSILATLLSKSLSLFWSWSQHAGLGRHGTVESRIWHSAISHLFKKFDCSILAEVPPVAAICVSMKTWEVNLKNLIVALSPLHLRFHMPLWAFICLCEHCL